MQTLLLGLPEETFTKLHVGTKILRKRMDEKQGRRRGGGRKRRRRMEKPRNKTKPRSMPSPPPVKTTPRKADAAG